MTPPVPYFDDGTVSLYCGDFREMPEVAGEERPSARIRGRTSPGHLGAAGVASYDYGTTRLAPSVIDARSMHGRAASETEKPGGVLRQMLAYGCPPGGFVLDPMAGACSSLVEARALGMRAVGIELREEQCAKAVAWRLAQDTLPLYAGEA